MTKPVRPSEIVLGRVVGFTLVGTVLLGVMGLLSYVFVVRGVSHTHELRAADLHQVGPTVAGEVAAAEGLHEHGAEPSARGYR